MIRAAILAAALAVTGAGFSAPALGAGDDNDPHMRFPTERGWELRRGLGYDRNSYGREEKSMDGSSGSERMNAPDQRREGTPGGSQSPGTPSGRY